MKKDSIIIYIKAIIASGLLLYRVLFNITKYKTIFVLPDNVMIKTNIKKTPSDNVVIDDILYEIVFITDKIINPRLMYKFLTLKKLV